MQMKSEIEVLEVVVVKPSTMAIGDVQKLILPNHIVEIEMEWSQGGQRA